MKNTISQLSFRNFFQIPMVKQLIFIFGVAGGVAIGIVLFTSIEEPIYRPLDYQVNSQNMSAIVDALDKSGIKYKMNEQDGVIMIPAKDMQLAHMKLSAAGVAKDDGFNFAYLNDQNGIGNSQFMENARYLRALENDLSKTMTAIEGVASARVHIAMPQGNVFSDENGKPTASVLLNISPGLSSDKEKIRAIVQIVSGSVPGLDPKDVAITDQYGHYLSNAVDTDAVYNAEQLNYQNNIQSYYEKRIESMIVPMVGENKVTVRVYAGIDFTQQEESQEQYDPDKKAVLSESSVNESNSAAGASGPAGSLSNTPPQTDAEKSSGGGSGSSQGRNESVKNYQVGKSMTYRKSNSAKVTNLSVAVVVDDEMQEDAKTHKMVSKPVDKDKIDKISELVKATIGFSEARGDKVTIINSSYNAAKTPEIITAQRPWNEPWFWDVIKRIVGIVLGFVFLFTLFRKMNSFMKISPKLATERPALVLDDAESSYVITPEMQQMKQQQVNKLKELASRDPNKVASVIKNWVGK